MQFYIKREKQKNSIQTKLVAWLGGRIVRRMNEVTLRWARLILGWVTVFWQVYYPRM